MFTDDGGDMATSLTMLYLQLNPECAGPDLAATDFAITFFRLREQIQDVIDTYKDLIKNEKTAQDFY